VRMKKLALVVFVVAVVLVISVDGKQLSASSGNVRQIARSYGLSEREIAKLKKKTPDPLPGCSDPKGTDFFSRFRTLEEIEEFLRNRFCDLRSEIGSLGSSCEVVEIGHSVEGRSILAVQIRNPSALRSKKEKVAWITGTLHAREWTGTTSVLLTVLRVDVTDVSVFAIPIINPDGYVYTWSGEEQIKKKFMKGEIVEDLVDARYWRKNRRVNSDNSIGVDLNRNFGLTSSIWGTDKKSKSITLTESDIYQGTAGFSEPETATMKRYFEKHKDKIVAFFDVHCCIGAILEPFTRQGKAPDYVFETGQMIIDAINTKAPANAKYEWRPRPVSSASGSGISSSWAFQEAKIPFVYVVEIRGKFVEKCTEIKPIGNEVLLGFRALLKQLSRMESIIAQYESSGRKESEEKTMTIEQQEREGDFWKQAGFFLGGGLLLAIGYKLKTKTEKVT